MEKPVTAEQLRREKLPVSNGYFEDWAGHPVVRTQFECIHDHLGYRIELQRARFPEKVVQGDDIPVEMDFINRGFATLINPRPTCLVLIDTSGILVLQQRVPADPRSWQPFQPDDSEYAPLTHQIWGELATTDLEAGEYMLGLWLPDASEQSAKDARYAVRLANNDVPWWTTAVGEYGVNVFGTVVVQSRQK